VAYASAGAIPARPAQIQEHRMPNRLARWLALVAGAWLVAGCASTTLQSTWMDSAYKGGPFKRIFVIGLSARDVTARRVLEDVLVAKLKAGGVDAVPAWQFLANDGPAHESALAAAVAASAGEAMLMVRLLGVDTQTTVWPTVMPGPGFGWYGFYSGWYAYPQVTQTQIAVIETTLFDVRSQRIVWSATSETINPSSVQKDAPGFAELILASLRKDGLLPALR
jgi:hypothetical protein